MAKTNLEDRKSYLHKSTCQEVVKDKTYIGDVHVPDNKDQQTPPQDVHHARLHPPGGWGVRDLL
jgi:hypothetical protein